MQEKSFWGKIKGWFSNLLGIADTKATTPDHDESQKTLNPANAKAGINQPPQLEAPDEAEQKYIASVNELNRAMIERCEDEIDKLRDDLNKASPHQLEVLIHWKFVELSLAQRDLKEQSSISLQQDVLALQKKNKGLQENYYSILEEIQARAKTNKILRWINVGQTAGYVGIIAITFATGGAGAILGLALPMLAVTKGGTSLAEGVLKYKNDLKTGDLFVVNEDIKTNNKKTKGDLLPAMQTINDDISTIFKALKHQLDAHQQTAQMLTRAK